MISLYVSKYGVSSESLVWLFCCLDSLATLNPIACDNEFQAWTGSRTLILKALWTVHVTQFCSLGWPESSQWQKRVHHMWGLKRNYFNNVEYCSQRHGNWYGVLARIFASYALHLSIFSGTRCTILKFRTVFPHSTSIISHAWVFLLLYSCLTDITSWLVRLPSSHLKARLKGVILSLLAVTEKSTWKRETLFKLHARVHPHRPTSSYWAVFQEREIPFTHWDRSHNVFHCLDNCPHTALCTERTIQMKP